MRSLDKHSPLKKKCTRGYLLWTRQLSIGQNSVIIFCEIGTIKIEKSTRNNGIIMSLYVETSKINHCSNLNEKIITDNKKFSKTVTQFFSDKVLSTK